MIINRVGGRVKEFMERATLPDSSLMKSTGCRYGYRVNRSGIAAVLESEDYCRSLDLYAEGPLEEGSNDHFEFGE